MKKFENAKFGDKLHSLKWGDCTVIKIEGGQLCLNSPNFGGSSFYRDLDGKEMFNALTPDLYWSKPEIIEPKRNVEKTIDVWVNYFSDNLFEVFKEYAEALTASATDKTPTIHAKLTFETEE